MVCVVSGMDRNGIGLDDCMGMDIMKDGMLLIFE